MKRFTTILVMLSALLSGCSSFDSSSAFEGIRAAEERHVCHIHGQTLTFVSVPIRYGDIAYYGPSGPSLKTRLTRFPFADYQVMGGCVIEVGVSPISQIIPRCMECEKTKIKWCSRHPDDRWSKEQMALKEGESNPEGSVERSRHRTLDEQARHE